MKKRIICLTLSVIMLLCSIVIPATAEDGGMPFRDVKSGKWYYKPIEYVWENGLMNGMTKDTFVPNGSMSRAMFVTVLCRFMERNLLLGADSITLTNQVLEYAAVVDKMSVTNTSGTFQGSFDVTSSLMYAVYGRAQNNTAVPSGWLIPFTYVNVGRPVKETDATAKVRLIVPHKQGHLSATRGVYPCLYDLTFERGR